MDMEDDMPMAPLPITLTAAQFEALARLGDALAPQLADLLPDERLRGAATRAFERLAAADAEPNDADLELERFAGALRAVRSVEMAKLLRGRALDILAVAVLWSAVESLSGLARADALLGIPAVDDPEWRAEVLDLLIDRGVEVHLPGDRARRASRPLAQAAEADVRATR